MSERPAATVGGDGAFWPPMLKPSEKPPVSEAVGQAATRLDAAYQRQMEAVSKARAEEVALLCTILTGLRMALPALVRPLLLQDVSGRGRPALLHLRAVQLFDDASEARPRGPRLAESVFLLEDGTFLRVRFTGATALTTKRRTALAVDRLEGMDVRHVLRDHGVEAVAAGLQRALEAQTGRREVQARNVAAYATRLRAVRHLLTC